MIVFAPKAPGATEKFEFDFTDRLGTDTIDGDATLTPDGATIDSHAVNGRKVDLVVSGGTAGTVATIECTLLTSGGETLYALAVLPIGGEAVDLATAKAAQRIDGTDQDSLLAGFLRAAIGAVEAATGKNLTQKVETQVIDRFPANGSGAVRLFKGPVSSATEIAYDAADGVEQVLGDFRLVDGGQSSPSRLLPAYSALWPTTASGEGAVRLTYVAGYEPAALPPELVQAVILLFGHYNANREAVIASNAAAAVELPLGVKALIDPYRAIGIA